MIDRPNPYKLIIQHIDDALGCLVEIPYTLLDELPAGLGEDVIAIHDELTRIIIILREEEYDEVTSILL